MAYSVCLYAVIMVIICLTAYDLSSALLTRDQEFLIKIFYSMFLLLMFIPLFSPVFSWLDVLKFVYYLAKWNEFQVCEILTCSRRQLFLKFEMNLIKRRNLHKPSELQPRFALTFRCCSWRSLAVHCRSIWKSSALFMPSSYAHLRFRASHSISSFHILPCGKFQAFASS